MRHVSAAEYYEQDESGITEAYNQLLQRAQNSFPENNIVQSLEEVQSQKAHPRKSVGTGEAVQRVKSETSQLADGLEIDITEFEEMNRDDELYPITVSVEQNVDQRQEQTQTQQQYIDIDQVIEDIERSTMPPEDEQEFKQIVRNFQDELEGTRDDSKLKQLLGRAEDYSVDVVAKLGILGLQDGVTGLISVV